LARHSGLAGVAGLLRVAARLLRGETTAGRAVARLRLTRHATRLLAREAAGLRISRLLAVSRRGAGLSGLSRVATRLLAEPIGLLAIRARLLAVRPGLLRRDGHRILLAGGSYAVVVATGWESR